MNRGVHGVSSMAVLSIAQSTGREDNSPAFIASEINIRKSDTQGNIAAENHVLDGYSNRTITDGKDPSSREIRGLARATSLTAGSNRGLGRKWASNGPPA